MQIVTQRKKYFNYKNNFYDSGHKRKCLLTLLSSEILTYFPVAGGPSFRSKKKTLFLEPVNRFETPCTIWIQSYGMKYNINKLCLYLEIQPFGPTYRQARIQDFEQGGALGFYRARNIFAFHANFCRPTPNWKINGATEVNVGR